MRNNIILLVTLFYSLTSCGQSNQNQIALNKNVLLAREVRVTTPTIVDNQINPEWTSELNRSELFNKTFSKVLSNKIPVYGIGPIDFEDIDNQEVTDIAKIPVQMAWENGNRNTDALKEILFYEKWYFDSENLRMTKKVLGWCPIRVWNEDGKEKKKLIFYSYPKEQNEGKLIGKNIFYEVSWNYDFPTTYVGFDKLAFLQFIIDGIKSRSINAYDPIYMVDKSKRKFSPQELEKYIDQELNPGKLNFYLNSMLFEEDWYFDENTLNIRKVVKSIAFVHSPYNPETDSFDKKILFFIFPK